MKVKEKIKKVKRQKGAAMLISVIFFLFISLAIISGLVIPSVRDFRSANMNLNSKKSHFLSESGVEDAYYRIINGMEISGSEIITLDVNTSTTTVTSPTSYTRQIVSLGDVENLERKTEINLETGAGIAFNYGLQAGDGGVTMGGGSTLIGNIYSNGSVNAISSTATGTVVAANSPALSVDHSNTTPSTPPNSINFRNASGSQDFAQSFQVSDTTLINKVEFYIRKVGNPANATVRLVADSSGSPSTTNIPIAPEGESISLIASSVTTSFAWVEVVFTSNPSLIPGATYWLVLDNGSQNSNNYYVMGANADTSYASGTAKTGAYSGSWNTTSLDGYFKIYTGGVDSMIGGAGYVGGFTVGTSGVGDAWATSVLGTSVAGNLYCVTGSNNNKACNTSQGGAPSEDLPFTDANITAWKDAAVAGGTITGNHSVGSGGGTLGPKKITGNLTVNGGGTLTLTGPLWVVGTVTLNGGGKIVLPSNYALNSETIISDSIVNISGGGSLGSGTSGSFLFIVSTSRCPHDTYCGELNAISISGGAGAIAVNAQDGTVRLNGGASLKAAVGNYLILSGGASVTYDSGLASPSFSSGPSGSWVLESWNETE